MIETSWPVENNQKTLDRISPIQVVKYWNSLIRETHCIEF